MADNNKNYSEFPIQAEENLSACEFTSFGENTLDYNENNASWKEYEEISENDVASGEGSASTSSSGSSSKTNSKITTGMAAVAGIAVIAISVISGSAAFTQFDVYGTSVDYKLETTIEYEMDETTIMDYDNLDTNLRIITYSDQTQETDLIYLATNNEELTSEVEVVSKSSGGGELKITFDGVIDGLFEGTSYTTQVVGEDSNGNLTVYLTKKFTTTGSQTIFKEVEWECKCRIDGYFYFTAKYVDDSGYYDNFYYRLISSQSGEVFEEGEMADPSKTQSIYVADADEMDYILEISFMSSAPIDIANGETNKVYSINVEV